MRDLLHNRKRERGWEYAAQGFPRDYKIAPECDGRQLTKTAQTSLAGNSVCPQVAAAVVAANVLGASRRAA